MGNLKTEIRFKVRVLILILGKQAGQKDETLRNIR